MNNTLQGEGTDSTYEQADFFGMQFRFNSLENASAIRFDNLQIYGTSFIDDDAPALLSVSALAPDSLRLDFDEALSPARARNAANYSLGGNSIAEAVYPADGPNQVLLRLQEPLSPGEATLLIVSGLADDLGNALVEPVQAQAYLPLYQALVLNELLPDPNRYPALPIATELVEVYNGQPFPVGLGGFGLADEARAVELPPAFVPASGYLVLCPEEATETLLSAGIPALGLPQWPTLNNAADRLTLFDATGAALDSVRYSAEWYGSESDGTLERVYRLSRCLSDSANWAVGGSPGRPNAAFRADGDRDPPALLSGEFFAPDELVLRFDRRVFDFANVNDFFSVESEGGEALAIVEADWEDGGLTVRLRTAALAQGEPYTLTVSGLPDCEGANPMAEETFAFGLARRPRPGDLVMNEVMFAPSSATALPNVEYVELLNRSAELLDLSACAFADAGDTLALVGQLPAGRLLLLTSPEGSAELTAFGLPEGIRLQSGPTFPAFLSNGGETLSLLCEGEPIERLAYSPAWYQDPDRDEGGYALERLDPDFACPGPANWRASVAEAGGTPGAPNSVSGAVEDDIAPQALSALPLGVDTVRVTFSEALDTVAARRAVFAFSPALPVDSIAFPEAMPDLAWLLLGEEMAGRTLYTLRIRDLRDCSGNLNGQSKSFQVVLPEAPAPADLQLSEILYDPPPQGVDFVELRNASDKFVNLQGVWLGNGEDSVQLSPDLPLVVLPFGYAALTEDPETLMGQYPLAPDSAFVQTGLPAFVNGRGTVTLSYLNHYEQVPYDDDWHFDLLRETEGVSLERIDYAAEADDRSAWRSAAEGAGFGTPGYANSQARESPVGNDPCFGFSPQAFSPDGDGIRDFSLLTFSCQRDVTATVRIYDETGREVATLARNQTFGAQQSLRWDGVDGQGRALRTGYYLALVETVSANGATERHYAKVAVSYPR